MNGIDTRDLRKRYDEGRTIRRTTRYTNGRELVREIKTRVILYRKVWREGEYEGGDVVTWGGSAWHCEVEKTTAKPGDSSDWRLMVKEGARGKDGKPDGPPTADGAHQMNFLFERVTQPDIEPVMLDGNEAAPALLHVRHG